MAAYLLKRIFVFIPTLFAISLISFTLTVNAPGDPVLENLTADAEGVADNEGVAALEREAARRYRQLGLHQPVFYFSLSSLAESDTLRSFFRPAERAALSRLTAEYGNWDQVISWQQSVHRFADILRSMTADSAGFDALLRIKANARSLRDAGTASEIRQILDDCRARASSLNGNLPAVQTAVNQIENAFQQLEQNTTVWKSWIPAIRFHGAQNQYHRWLMKAIRLDFGASLRNDGKTVMNRISSALGWSIFINLFGLLIAYLTAIPLGIYSARFRGTSREKFISAGLFVLYSLPVFWVATLLVTYLASNDFLSIFPAQGLHTDGSERWSGFSRFLDLAWHLTLPTLCYAYHSVTFLSRQMRSSMLDVLNADYIRTARAKGLPEKAVIRRHALRNSLLPLITQFAGVFPALVSGSVIIEAIFAIPGMGNELVTSIEAHDYNTTIGIFTITAVLTLMGILISDILYVIADPRISFARK